MIRTTISKGVNSVRVAASCNRSTMARSFSMISNQTKTTSSIRISHNITSASSALLSKPSSSSLMSGNRINMMAVRNYSAGPAPLTREFALERIVGLLQCYAKVPENAELTPETSFTKDLGLDSLDVVEVVLAIEEEFSILIPDHEADEIKTVGQAVDYILHQPDAL